MIDSINHIIYSQCNIPVAGHSQEVISISKKISILSVKFKLTENYSGAPLPAILKTLKFWDGCEEVLGAHLHSVDSENADLASAEIIGDAKFGDLEAEIGGDSDGSADNGD